jgi:hypothetical protein
MVSVPQTLVCVFSKADMVRNTELRTWVSKVQTRSRGGGGGGGGSTGGRSRKERPGRPASPIMPGLLHTPSRPSSFILDIGTSKADLTKAELEIDPWANSRVTAAGTTYMHESKSPITLDMYGVHDVPDVYGAATVRPVRSSESVARQQLAQSYGVSPFSPASETGSSPFTGTSPSISQPPQAAGKRFSAGSHPSSHSSNHSQPTRRPHNTTTPSLSVRTSLPASATTSGRPNGPRSPSSPSSSPEYTYGTGGTFGYGGVGGSEREREPSHHSAGTGGKKHANEYYASPRTGYASGHTYNSASGQSGQSGYPFGGGSSSTTSNHGYASTGYGGGYGLGYSPYDTHEKPDWMPPMPPATLLAPVPEAHSPYASQAGSFALSQSQSQMTAHSTSKASLKSKRPPRSPSSRHPPPSPSSSSNSPTSNASLPFGRTAGSASGGGGSLSVHHSTYRYGEAPYGGGAYVQAQEEEERRSPTPPRLSPIMWARPEEYRDIR